MTVPGGVGAVDPVAVEQAWARLGQIDVPDLVGVLGDGDAANLALRDSRVEEAEIDRGRVFAEKGEVDAGAVPGGARRVGSPGCG